MDSLFSVYKLEVRVTYLVKHSFWAFRKTCITVFENESEDLYRIRFETIVSYMGVKINYIELIKQCIKYYYSLKILL